MGLYQNSKTTFNIKCGYYLKLLLLAKIKIIWKNIILRESHKRDLPLTNVNFGVYTVYENSGVSIRLRISTLVIRYFLMRGNHTFNFAQMTWENQGIINIWVNRDKERSNWQFIKKGFKLIWGAKTERTTRYAFYARFYHHGLTRPNITQIFNIHIDLSMGFNNGSRFFC